MKDSSSYPPCRKIMPNLNAIREHGIAKFVRQQRRRIALLVRMIKNFDDGRLKSYYCRSAALLDPAALERSLDAAARKMKTDHVRPNDVKTRARLLRSLLDDLASKEGMTA
jgi:hypothetical protein